MTIARLLPIPLTAIVAFALTAMAGGAATTTQGGDAPPTTSEHHDQAPLPSAASMIAPQASSLEDDLAQLVQKRDGVPAAMLPWLELKIDSRIFARWLLTQAGAGREQDSQQIGGYLHSLSMLAVIPIVDDYASKQSAEPNSVQSVGMSRLHQLTFQLKHADNIAALDAACASVAGDIQIIITPMQGGDRLPAFVAMRPDVAPSSAPIEVSIAEQHGPKTIDELAALARQASVSPALRRELIAMATLAQQAQADSDHPQEAQTLRSELADALDLVAGLQTNIAVTTQERGQIESQLCDALALFGDPRVREAGRARLASLDKYRQLLGRVEKMRVPPELTDALSPALTWVHDHPDLGDKVLGALERFVALHVAHGARPQQPEEFASLRPNDPLRRAYEEVNKQFIKAHADFLGAAAALGSAMGATRDGASTSAGSGPEALGDRASEMSRLEDLLDLLAALPKTIQTLEAFKPRPTGAIQRRVNSMLFTVESAMKSPTRDEATKQLAELNELSDLADQLSSQTVATLSPAVAQAYTGDQLAGLETKWKSMVMEMAGAFCINQPIDSDKLNRLKAARGLLEALAPAADMEAAFAQPAALAKWADWTITPQQMQTLMEPYQQAMSQAFAGFISENPDALVAFARLRTGYEPMMALFARTGALADGCAPLPEGTVGLLSRLATPYERAPFAEQRFASFIAALAGSADEDPAICETAARTISNRVGR